MGDTVYLVTSGNYSDYRVEGIFSTEAGAEHYVRAMLYGTYDHPRIKAWEIDATAGENGLWPYMVTFWNTGESAVDAVRYGTPDEHGHIRNRTNAVEITVRARDSGHALKIASDLRAEWLARHAGIS